MKYKVAALTLDIERTRKENMNAALSLIDEAVNDWNVKAVCLPEFFNTSVPTDSTTKDDLLKVAEPVPGPITDAISAKAEKHKIYIVAGSIVEKAGDKLYDTCPFIGPNGKLIGKVSVAN